MSYNCSLAIQSDTETLEILEKGLSSLREAQIEISCGELEADFREDTSGVVSDLAEKYNLSFTMDFYDEDDIHYFLKYINGTEVDSEVL